MSTLSPSLPGAKPDIAPIHSALATATSSKPRRAVRLLSQLPADDSSSSEEDDTNIGPSEDIIESRQEGLGTL